MAIQRKRVLAWIRNLSNGRYKKTENALVSKNLSSFCCLGVWADMNGCSFVEDTQFGEISWVPVLPGKDRPIKSQRHESGTLYGATAFGLKSKEQEDLADLNDGTRNWDKVIDYIKTNILPRAK